MRRLSLCHSAIQLIRRVLGRYSLPFCAAIFMAFVLPTAVTCLARTVAGGIAQPMAVAASSDGRWAVIANRQTSTIVRVDLASRAPTRQVQCSCSPTILLSLAGNSVFLLTPLGTGPLSLFDGDAAKPRILFIPGNQQANAPGIVR